MSKATQLKSEIAEAAQDAVKLIATATAEAAKTIANAASEAKQVVANNAATAAQALVVKNADGVTDHDLITRLDVKLDNLKVDIADLKSGTSNQIADHEGRIKMLENSNTVLKVTLGLYGLALMACLIMVAYHILHTPIT